ncbi:hypothetical protein [Streptomyces sp. NPDC092952]|uniref:hypothetical protein n=1 Tax=Streptomyces sp. NPDC092952 TaxID=3366018 RepID=UPI00381B9F0D
MSGGGAAPVDPVGIPVFTGDLALLDVKVTELSGCGAKIAEAAGDVHTSFGGLSAFYQAPEAEQLFATTAPVAAKGLSLSEDLRVVAGALGTYSDDAFPLVEKLKALKRDAVAFRVKVNGDDDWDEDGDLVEENNRRRNEIAEVWAAFQEVERACHAKIVALVGGHPLKTGDGSGKSGTYGYDAEALKQAPSLPWGEPVEESVPWWKVWRHAYDFGKGFIVDGVGGTLEGLGILVGTEGWDSMKQAWTGLAKLATGVTLAITPGVNGIFWAAPDDELPAWVRDSRAAMKETGKALIAWDQWGSNPSRAAGAVTFNVLTTVFTGGTGGSAAGAGKAGALAKTLSVAGKTARVVDPMTYVFKGAGAGLTKVSDVMTGLKGLETTTFPPLPDHVITVPEGTLRLPDGTLHLPEGAAIPDGATALPNGTVELPDGAVALPEGAVRSPFAGEAAYFDRDGNLYKEDGTLLQRADQATKERNLNAQPPAAVHEPALTGAVAHHTPDHTPPGNTSPTPPHNHLDTTIHHTELPGTRHSPSHDLPAGSGTGGGGGGVGGGGPDGFARDISDPGGWDRPQDHSGPLELGGEMEAQVRGQLTSTGVKPDDIERALNNLSKNPAGQEISEIISSGKLGAFEGYREVVSGLSRLDGISGGIEQLRLGERLLSGGADKIVFEIKQDGYEIKPGVFTGEKTDLDVMARDVDGTVYGWQLKDMTGPESPADPGKVVRNVFKKIRQLTDSHADVKIFLVETKASRAEIATQLGRLHGLHAKNNVQFIFRSPDGNLFVPPEAKFFPKGSS